MRHHICPTCSYVFFVPPDFAGKPVCPSCLYRDLVAQPSRITVWHRGIGVGMVLGALLFSLLKLWL